MYLPDFELHEAQSPAEAAALLAEHAPDALLMAGGTDLLVDLKTGRRTAGHVVWLNRIEALRGIASDADGVCIGALTTISQLLDSAVVRDRCRPLLDAASQMAAPQIRNLATIGGNIACAAPCADIPPILMVMSASVELVSATGTRRVLVDELFVGPRATVIRADEVLTAVHIPDAPVRSGAAYARFALRDGNAIAVAASAARLVLDDTDCIAAARIALGAVAPMPMMVVSAAAGLTGKQPGDEAFDEAAQTASQACRPITDVRGTADFRREMVRVMTRRALQAALDRAREARS
ncbi:MAG: xanthine dehydrogenase family protein subunit M [Planctomycetes bacterium]|nr:xanthine dehydrogenase family protein subunit M [Planctomycetota bacterium]